MTAHFLNVYSIAVAWLRSPTQDLSSTYLFRSYDQHTFSERNDPLRTPAGELPTYQIARALLASPGYFAPFKIENCEFSGSTKECNPSIAVLKEVIERVDTPENTNTFFISIGSGKSSRSNVSNVLASSPHEASLLRNMTYPNRGARKYSYHRLNPSLMLGAIKLDEWEIDKVSGELLTINRITRATEKYLAEPFVQESLRVIARFLVKNRRASSEKSNLIRY